MSLKIAFNEPIYYLQAMSWPLWFGVLLAAAALLTALGEFTARQGWISLFAARKGVHITVALCCALAVEVVPMSPWFLAVVGLIVVALWYSVRQRIFSIDRLNDRRSWGIFYFGLSYFILLVLFGERSPLTVMLGMAVMGLADAIAALVGRMLPKPPLTLGREVKSWSGSLSFLIICSILLFSIVNERLGLQGLAPWILVVLVLWLTIVENSAGNGTDNLSVPLLFAWVFATLIDVDEPESAQQRFLWIAFPAAVFAFLGHWSKALTRDGSITAASLGIILYTYGGWAFVAPMLLFFVSGSLFSRILQIPGQRTEKSGSRDPWQVLANGGIPAIALLFGVYTDHLDWAYTMYLSALACATADTWATEFGMRFGGKPRHILTGRVLAPGLSGGVTIVGFCASFLGALSIASFALLFVSLGSWFWWVVGLGFLGSVVDSLLGIAQGKYIDNTSSSEDSITERPEINGQQNEFATGYKWLNNDLVNALSSAFALVSAALFAGAAP